MQRTLVQNVARLVGIVFLVVGYYYAWQKGALDWA